MDYVWIRLDQKGPDNNLCAKRVCLGKSVTLQQQWGKAKRQWEEEGRTKMTTRTMCLASGFLDSLSASETAARRSRTDRGDRIHLYVLV